jgi:hypothetical protein
MPSDGWNGAAIDGITVSNRAASGEAGKRRDRRLPSALPGVRSDLQRGHQALPRCLMVPRSSRPTVPPDDSGSVSTHPATRMTRTPFGLTSFETLL